MPKTEQVLDTIFLTRRLTCIEKAISFKKLWGVSTAKCSENGLKVL
jgi:hypothetical protein